ncbi:hypothetical protein LY90DRAFT_511509 [Neocallimastix californiae]|jgi:Leucine-rich repeat (LRR) protein|uniref:L domain-like protein n=1 Tax=Neocallimastix californiae TaxID=1754190 RepID=A0A1Y2BPC6_9FUNG|nr:hypothetical protein LY90DRAFT_511509 [Neocallimastix californiae]|eukprot:ORY36612.1 hypothetical protein LY90DRAFT_511509 [Neocallimastix californiae]
MKFHNIYFTLINISIIFHEASGETGQTTSGQAGQFINVSSDCQSLNQFFQIDPTTNCCEDVCTEYDTQSQDVECIDNISIECDANNNVIRLINESCNFSDESINVDYSNFPILPNLKELEIINMHNKAFPSILFNLPHLEVLKISNSNITEFSNEVNSQSPIKEIYLDNDQINNFPYQFNKLPNLKYLNLNNNEIKELSKDTGSFSSIEKIELNNNLDLFSLPEEISDLIHLQVLDLGKTDLIELPNNIFKLSNLKSFNISFIPDLNAKIINFGSTIDECNFENTTISCYQPDTCKKIIGGQEYPECTEQEIQQIIKGQKETDLERKRKLKIIGYIIGGAGLIIAILLGFIIYNRRSRKIKKEKLKHQEGNSDSNNNIYVSERIIVLPDNENNMMTASTMPLANVNVSSSPSSSPSLRSEKKAYEMNSDNPSEPIYEAYPTSPTMEEERLPRHASISKNDVVVSSSSGSNSQSQSQFHTSSSRAPPSSQYHSRLPPHPEEPPIYSALNELNSANPMNDDDIDRMIDAMEEIENDNVLPPYSATDHRQSNSSSGSISLLMRSNNNKDKHSFSSRLPRSSHSFSQDRRQNQLQSQNPRQRQSQSQRQRQHQRLHQHQFQVNHENENSFSYQVNTTMDDNKFDKDPYLDNYYEKDYVNDKDRYMYEKESSWDRYYREEKSNKAPEDERLKAKIEKDNEYYQNAYSTSEENRRLKSKIEKEYEYYEKKKK